jgi:multicomponent Na+:H+ antiporter subunit D
MTLVSASPLLPLLITAPLLAGIAAFLCRPLARWLALLASLAMAGILGLLTAEVLTSGPLRYFIGGWQAPLGINLRVDGLSLVLLWSTTLVNSCVVIYGFGYFPSAVTGAAREQSLLFWPMLLFLWTALNALFLAADLFNIYVCLELLSLAAVALTGLAGNTAARRAAMRYLLLGWFGSACYLFGVILLYREFGLLDLAALGEVLVWRPPVRAALAFILLALILKTALFPLHIWLPPAHANAAAPVSAVLSALVVKASFYLLMRFWLELFPLPAEHVLLQFLGVLGSAAIFWGSFRALTADRLKLLIAYSTVAQLGYLFLLFPLLGTTDRFLAWSGALYFLLAHALAKGALFLAAGIAQKQTGGDRLTDLAGLSQTLPLTSFTFALSGISLMGMPPTGGFAAKWSLLHAAILSGQWWWTVVIASGSLLTAAYLLRPLAQLYRQVPAGTIFSPAPVPAVMQWTAFVLACSTILLGLFPAQLAILMEAGLQWPEVHR